MITYKEFYADDIASVVDDIAKLRIEVFREFPYLYDGDMESEREHTLTLSNATSAYVVVAFDEAGDAVGLITCSALSDADEGVIEAFAQEDIDLTMYCYFGEVVLRRDMREVGIGRKLIDYAEHHTSEYGYHGATLCSVDRAVEHPMRPADYRPIDQILQRRGFEKSATIKADMSWQQVDGSEINNRLSFWFKYNE